jgi:hypothetical protein
MHLKATDSHILHGLKMVYTYASMVQGALTLSHSLLDPS